MGFLSGAGSAMPNLIDLVQGNSDKVDRQIGFVISVRGFVFGQERGEGGLPKARKLSL